MNLLNFKNWLVESYFTEMATLNFGGDKGHRGKDHTATPTHYLKWMQDQLTTGNANFNVSDQGRRLSNPEIKSLIDKELSSRSNPQVPAMKSVTQIPQTANVRTSPESANQSWIWAKSLVTRPEYQLPAPNLDLAMKQYDANNWMFVILDPEEGRLVSRGTIPIIDLKNVVKSQKGEDGNLVKGRIPSDVLRAITPKKETKGHTIPDNQITDEQKAIDEKFVSMLNSPKQSHMMVNALAGTGKTTTLKHLAWKYSKGKKWLYLVFNSKNKQEAKDEFPPSVQVETTNGWAGREVLGKNHLNPTDRIQDYSQSEKAKMIADSAAFKNFTVSMKIPDEVQTYGPDPKMLGGTERSLWYIIRSLNREFKSEAVRLLGLSKSFAIDPRNTASLENNINNVIGNYDLNVKMSDTKESVSKNSPWAIKYLDRLMPVPFMDRDFTKELTKATIWLLQQSMPHASQEKFVADVGNFSGSEQNLGTKRDFDDDLWYSAIHADELKWPKYDVVLADEVQDFNFAQKIILKKLAENGAKIVAVGDPGQCVIEGTLISTSNGELPVEEIKVHQEVLTGKGGGYVLPSKVTDVFVRYVENISVVKITTKNGKSITTTADHTHFAGFVDDFCPERYFTYLMYKEKLGYRIGVSFNFGKRLNQERADKIWLLEASNSRATAQYYEQLYSIKYGLPTWVFLRNANQIYSQDCINKLFDTFDTSVGANKLLEDKGMFIDYPHHLPKCMNRKRYRNFNIVLCGDCRNTGLHRYSIAGTDINDSEMIPDIMKIRKAKFGWRCENSTQYLKNIYEMANSLKFKFNIIEKARLSDKTLPFIPASHVLPGMSIYTYVDGSIVNDLVEKVEMINYTGNIYDLNVDRYHNFIGNSIVSHNSVYRFRGSDSDSFAGIASMLKDLSDDKNVEKTISKNFRSRQAVIDLSNQEGEEFGHVSNLVKGRPFKELPGKIGKGSATKYEMKYDQAFDILDAEKKDMGEIKQTAFLSRTNEPLVHASLKLMKQGTPFVILGKDIANDLMKHIDKIISLFRLNNNSLIEELATKLSEYQSEQNDMHHGRVAMSGKLKELKETTEAMLATIVQFGEEKSEGSIFDFRKWLKDKFGGVDLEKSGRDGDAIRADYKKKLESENPVILTTVHKSKGLQFQRVFILRDDMWPHPRATRQADLDQEMNNRYVGRTRAEDELHILDLKGQPGYRTKDQEKEQQD